MTIVWASLFLASIFTRDYQPLIYVSPPMGIVVGFITGIRILRRVNGEK